MAWDKFLIWVNFTRWVILSAKVNTRVPRVFKRRKVSRSQKYIISTPRKFEYISKRDPTSSEWPVTAKSYTTEWYMYTPDVAPSLLGWLIGCKDCL